MELDRRQLLGGISVAAAGVAAGAALTSQAHAEEAAAPVTYAQFNEAMRQTLRLDSNLVGVKFYESADDVPEGAVSPKRDLGKHIATCQAFSMARYNGQTVVMTKEDEWCWAPLVGYGQVDCSDGIDSCVYELVNTMDRNNYQVCFPDCGEVVRARTKQIDATFCIPASKLQGFMDCACGWGVSGFGFNFEAQYDYALDYSRPPFYNEVFNMWGLDTGVDWAISGDYGK